MTTNNTTPTDPEQLREEIEQTRAELGETAAALAAPLSALFGLCDFARPG